jgi:putative heme-binding domain-containing protein
MPSLTAFLPLLLAALLPTTLHSADQRVPWANSGFHGTPEPPLPFRVERAFPKLTFDQPLEAATIPGTNRMVVIELAGRLRSFPYDDAAEKTDLFGDMKTFDPEVSQCYSIAFHPHFSENRLAYVWILLDSRGKVNLENGTRIVQFHVTTEDPPRLDISSGKVIFSWLGGGHNGGSVRFGPDGMLYISTGDGGVADPPDGLVSGQNLGTVLSSVLRIDVDHPDAGKPYGIPKDNPFVTMPNARGEKWSYGLRNPWRMSFDPKNGELYVADVGWELWEMVHRIQRGGNSGWSITEGGKQDVRPDRLRGPSPILAPLVVHSHEEAASITGGEFYHGKKLPELEGAYLYGDWQMGTFWSLRADGDRVTEHRELCHTPLMPAGFGLTPDSEVLICDYAAGGLWRFIRNPDAGQPPHFPTRLSQTGLFSDVSRQSPSPGVFPYRITATRWADHATSERWAAFSNSADTTVARQTLGVMPVGRWVFPEQTVFAKTYSLELERGKPATRRRIETQVLYFDGLQWGAYSYRWNDAQTDAELVPAHGEDAIYPVKDASAPDGVLQQKWRFFGRVECLRCHNPWDNYAAAFSSLQLDRVTPEAPGRQLDTLARLGLAPDEPALTDPFGTRGTLEVRARSYLHANCGVCHRFNGGGAVPTFLSIETPLKDAHTLQAKPVQGDLGLPDARVVATGDPFRSVLLYRMTTGGRGHMPYLGGKLVDERGVLLIRDWIASMRLDPRDPSEATRHQREAEQASLAKLKSGDASALDPLLATNSGALSVVLAVIDGSLTGDLRAQAIARGAAIPDPVRRDLFERFLPESQRRIVLGNNIDPLALVAAKGDAARGKLLFTTICTACHRANGVGIDFGPDLSQIAKKWDRAGLLDQVLYPSKVIEPQWLLATVSLANGESRAGFITTRTDDELTLKMAGGLVEKIPNKQVTKTTTQRISVMPEGILQNLTAGEAADLLEFLSSLK